MGFNSGFNGLICILIRLYLKCLDDNSEILMVATCREAVPFYVFYLTTSLVKYVTVTDRGKRTFQMKKPPKYHFMQHKSHIECPGIEPGTLRWKAGDYFIRTLA